ncbi:MAG: winged helix-turn-helix transcriptional regulator [Thermomicrobiaceae bacterium]|nr:winged helix-turn-helix transcriptional regulator [Thermomicrobiaceae bacterium]
MSTPDQRAPEPEEARSAAAAREQAAQRIEITTKFFRGLTDPTRLRIVELLLEEGEKNVSELVEILGQPQSRVSSHLACLRWCGYVASRREGKYVYYRIADERVASLLLLAHGIIADHAEAIVSCTRM